MPSCRARYRSIVRDCDSTCSPATTTTGPRPRLASSSPASLAAMYSGAADPRPAAILVTSSGQRVSLNGKPPRTIVMRLVSITPLASKYLMRMLGRSDAGHWFSCAWCRQDAGGSAPPDMLRAAADAADVAIAAPALASRSRCISVVQRCCCVAFVHMNSYLK
eukprot:scaffold9555_cov123-Isochrysis_galbana.AAC.7